jgi:cholesterol oxidase
MGCDVGAKNTLVKNYLWFAEQAGVRIVTETEAIDIRPLDGRTGATGYEVHARRSTAWLRRERRTLRARGVVVAEAALGTNQLLARCRLAGGLPNLSSSLGEKVRTNSEAMLAVTLPDDRLQPGKDVAISASVHVSRDTHIELVTYGERGSVLKLFFTLLAGEATRLAYLVEFLKSNE